MLSSGRFRQACLNRQGFDHLAEPDKVRLDLPLRFTPALCLALAAVGVVLRSPLLLGALATGAVIAALDRAHPFDWLYNTAVQPLIGGPALPPNPSPRRFAFVMAAPVLAGTTVAFALDAAVLGTVLGALQLAGCATYVATGWCPGSFAHEKLFGRRLPTADVQLGADHG
ncbi:MAG: DUF4395 domain-containing protein [Actinomycetota bacterium]|nr:DUF4395 domain-containing protein [Actinomycetota bacterium]